MIAYQVADLDLGASGGRDSSESLGSGVGFSSPRLPHAPRWTGDLPPNRDTSSTATDAAAATLGANDLVEGLIKLGVSHVDGERR